MMSECNEHEKPIEKGQVRRGHAVFVLVVFLFTHVAWSVLGLALGFVLMEWCLPKQNGGATTVCGKASHCDRECDRDHEHVNVIVMCSRLFGDVLAANAVGNALADLSYIISSLSVTIVDDAMSITLPLPLCHRRHYDPYPFLNPPAQRMFRPGHFPDSHRRHKPRWPETETNRIKLRPNGTRCIYIYICDRCISPILINRRGDRPMLGGPFFGEEDGPQ